jgi:hypothetical protein
MEVAQFEFYSKKFSSGSTYVFYKKKQNPPSPPTHTTSHKKKFTFIHPVIISVDIGEGLFLSLNKLAWNPNSTTPVSLTDVKTDFKLILGRMQPNKP